MLVVRTKSNHFGVDSSKISMQIICHFWTINPRFYIIFSILKLLFKVNPRYNTIYSLNFGPFRYHCRSFYVKNYGGRKIIFFFRKSFSCLHKNLSDVKKTQVYQYCKYSKIGKIQWKNCSTNDIKFVQKGSYFFQ